MADRSSGSLHFGGALPASARERLAGAIVAEGGGEAYDEPYRDAGEVIFDIEAAQAAGEPFALFGLDLVGGEFGDLPALLAELGLPYVSQWDPHYAYSAGVAMWRPGMDGRDELPADNEGTPLTDLRTLEIAIGAGAVEALRDRMRAFYPDSLPPLTHLQD